MAILLNFIISKGDLLEMNPLPVVHHQSEKFDNLTDTVHSHTTWTLPAPSVSSGNEEATIQGENSSALIAHVTTTLRESKFQF